jgi:hypothetical protein
MPTESSKRSRSAIGFEEVNRRYALKQQVKIFSLTDDRQQALENAPR